MRRRPPGSIRTYTLVPSPTLFRSTVAVRARPFSRWLAACRRVRGAVASATARRQARRPSVPSGEGVRKNLPLPVLKKLGRCLHPEASQTSAQGCSPVERTRNFFPPRPSPSGEGQARLGNLFPSLG